MTDLGLILLGIIELPNELIYMNTLKNKAVFSEMYFVESIKTRTFAAGFGSVAQLD